MTLFTIGYEGRTADEFFRQLQQAGVQTILDVRQMPLSRKPGFSKNALAQAAEAHGLGYRHLPPFGCPRPIRDQYRRDGCWECYTTRFLAYLDTLDDALADLAQLVTESRCCLLCFEADPNRCHRSFVAARVAEISAQPLTVYHLTAANPKSLASRTAPSGAAGKSAR